MERRLAIFISYLFHPLWMPLYMVFLLFWINLNGAEAISLRPWIYIFAVVLINTIFLPISIIWLMKKMSMIQSMSLEQKQDRLYPFFISAIFYFTTWYVFNSLNIFPFLPLIFIISSILVFIAIIINVFWKISVHSISMGAVSAAILFLTASQFIISSWPAYIIFLLAGLVGFARLKLQAHHPSQIYVGFLLGFVVVLGLIFGIY
ncbi:MAG: phosphatase PAP2 family protein [Bacteroidales bacterium]|nr:phosphatase PAP2 family protein [Bacteroidales bacterium]